jgi:hypothetical protein
MARLVPSMQILVTVLTTDDNFLNFNVTLVLSSTCQRSSAKIETKYVYFPVRNAE